MKNWPKCAHCGERAGFRAEETCLGLAAPPTFWCTVHKPVYALPLLVFVCSPLKACARHTLEGHMAWAARVAAEVKALGAVPVVPHLWLSPVLDDTDARQRRLGRVMGEAALPLMDVFCVAPAPCDRESEGMQAETALAEVLGLWVVHRPVPAGRTA